MKTYHLRVYVGPTLVAPMACKFRGAGLKVTVEGTAHIHCVVDSDGDVRFDFLKRLREKYDSTFCITLRDVEVVRSFVYASEESFA